MNYSRFPISFWGTISYFKHFCSCENPIIEIHETYKKQSIRNRAYLLNSSGVFNLTLPVIKSNGNKTLTKDVLVDFSQDFQNKNWKSLKTAYQSSPYFEHYEIDIKPIFFNKSKYLIDHCFLSNEFILKSLNIEKDIIFSINFYSNYNFDFLHDFNKRNEKYIHNNYNQVFNSKSNFEYDLSILDAIFNIGPLARKIII